jgi:SAM-dependent methyltransferase
MTLIARSPSRSRRFRLRLRFTPAACLLACLLACLPAAGGVAAQDPAPDPAQLESALVAARERGDDAAALAAALELHWDVAARHWDLAYEIACLHARLGHRGRAYVWLKKAVDAGYWDMAHMRQDTTWSGYHEEGLFRELVRGAWLNGYLTLLDRDERDEIQMPGLIMEKLAFRPGERVADLGAGSGYFTIPVAKAVGPEGIVWALDIRQEMLDAIELKLRAERIENVRLRKVEAEDPLLPEDGVDTILMVDVWHYIRDPEYARKLRAGLAPGGRVVVIDYRPRPMAERPWGPPPQQQTPREEVDAHFAQAGLRPVASHDFLPEQYFVVYCAE